MGCHRTREDNDERNIDVPGTLLFSRNKHHQKRRSAEWINSALRHVI
jgi:hypothetical protein